MSPITHEFMTTLEGRFYKISSYCYSYFDFYIQATCHLVMWSACTSKKKQSSNLGWWTSLQLASSNVQQSPKISFNLRDLFIHDEVQSIKGISFKVVSILSQDFCFDEQDWLQFPNNLHNRQVKNRIYLPDTKIHLPYTIRHNFFWKLPNKTNASKWNTE